MFRYKFNVGDTVELRDGEITILKQTFKTKKNGTRISAYEYKCNTCNYVGVINQTDMVSQGCGCSACNGKKTMIGYNDLWTTNPSIASLLNNPNDGYKYRQQSNKKVEFKCPNCNLVQNKAVSKVYSYGFRCEKCSDNISFPEKVIIGLLDSCDIEYIQQYRTTHADWTKDYRYDFYLPKFDCIIECHGEQHYINTHYAKLKGGIASVSANDKAKEELAKLNVSYFIDLDCRYTTIKHIRESVENSILFDVIGVKSVDWEFVHGLTVNTRTRDICNLYNESVSVMEIVSQLNIDKETVRNHLIRGTEIGLCDYNPKDTSARYRNARKKSSEVCSKSVICLNDMKIHNSCTSCDKYYGLYGGATSAIATGVRKSSKGLKFKFINNYSPETTERVDIHRG